MRVMGIGEMGVGVPQWPVNMGMNVGFARRVCGAVFMLVMHVVDMGMGMLERFVLVRVFVVLA